MRLLSLAINHVDEKCIPRVFLTATKQNMLLELSFCPLKTWTLYWWWTRKIFLKYFLSHIYHIAIILIIFHENPKQLLQSNLVITNWVVLLRFSHTEENSHLWKSGFKAKHPLGGPVLIDWFYLAFYCCNYSLAGRRLLLQFSEQRWTVNGRTLGSMVG